MEPYILFALLRSFFFVSLFCIYLYYFFQIISFFFLLYYETKRCAPARQFFLPTTALWPRASSLSTKELNGYYYWHGSRSVRSHQRQISLNLTEWNDELLGSPLAYSSNNKSGRAISFSADHRRERPCTC